MAFDGITIANIVKELNDLLVGGRLYKIAQPEADELLLTVKTANGQYRLLISASASLPLLYLTEKNKPGPLTAPNFCMLLRKHLQNGRIIGITQPGLERAVHIELEHLDELGDLCRKTLIVEIMGKHSNIIFCGADGTIIDSIKRVSALVSSVREVLPGKPYFVPRTVEKEDALTADRESFESVLRKKAMPVFKAVYNSYTGISPVMAQEICYRAKVDGEQAVAGISAEETDRLYEIFHGMMKQIQAGEFTPCVAYTGREPVEFGAFMLTMYEHGADHTERCESMSALLESYYAEKNSLTRIRQKSADLRKIVQTALERNVKKYDLQASPDEGYGKTGQVPYLRGADSHLRLQCAGRQ